MAEVDAVANNRDDALPLLSSMEGVALVISIRLDLLLVPLTCSCREDRELPPPLDPVVGSGCWGDGGVGMGSLVLCWVLLVVLEDERTPMTRCRLRASASRRADAAADVSREDCWLDIVPAPFLSLNDLQWW